MLSLFASTLAPRQYKGNTDLSEIKLSDSIQIIPRECFHGCTNLTRIIIPRSVKRIDFKAFANSGIEEVIFEIDSSIRVLSKRCFESCLDLTTISLPSSLNIIGDFSFQNCGMLRNRISILDNVREIGAYSFGKCGVEYVDIACPENVVMNVVDEQKYKYKKVVTLNIGYGSFDECPRLQSVQISSRNNLILPTSAAFPEIDAEKFLKTVAFDGLNDVVTPTSSLASRKTTNTTSNTNTPINFLLNISQETFACCDQLRFVHIFPIVQSIGQSAFANSNIEEVIFSQDSQFGTIPSRLFLRCSNLKTLILPSSIKRIGKYAFSGSGINTEIVADIFANCNIQYIHSGAFQDCPNFVGTLSIPSSIKVLGKSVFSYSNIEKVIFSEDSQLKIIPPHTFSKCINLRAVSLPSSVTSIGEYAFADSRIDTESVTDILTTCNIQYIREQVFRNCKNLTGIITIPSSIKTIGRSVFKNCGIEGLFFSQDSQLETIPDSFASGCTNLQVVSLPPSVKSIGGSAFFGSAINSESISRIFTSSRIEDIGNNTFFCCYNITETIYIPSSLKTMGQSVFANSSVRKIIFPQDSLLEIISERSFECCSNLEMIILPQSLKSIKECAFTDCQMLKSMTLPSSVTSLGIGTFSYSSIEEILFSEDSRLETIPLETFSQCSSLKLVSLPPSVKVIGKHAFSGTGIDDKTIATIFSNCNIEHIGESAFAKCEEIKSIILPPSLKLLDQYAFSESSIENVKLPLHSQLAFLPNFVFSECRSLKSVTLPSSIKIEKLAFHGSGIGDCAVADIIASCNCGIQDPVHVHYIS